MDIPSAPMRSIESQYMMVRDWVCYWTGDDVAKVDLDLGCQLVVSKETKREGLLLTFIHGQSVGLEAHAGHS